MNSAFLRMAEGIGLKPSDTREMAPLSLAFLGDTVYDLYVRAYLVHACPMTVNDLHRKASLYVCAAAQAEAYHKIEGRLTEKEADVFRRGRNAHSATVPKNASVSDYRIATGVETLFGWLFSRGEDERIDTLMKIILTENEKDEI